MVDQYEERNAIKNKNKMLTLTVPKIDRVHTDFWTSWFEPLSTELLQKKHRLIQNTVQTPKNPCLVQAHEGKINSMATYQRFLENWKKSAELPLLISSLHSYLISIRQAAPFAYCFCQNFSDAEKQFFLLLR